MFGKRLHNDGRLTECPRQPVTILKKWYEDSRFCMPQGSILMQSSTAHQWPYPAYLFGRGAWAAVDILHFLPDVPITFMGEVNGDAYRLGTQARYQAEKSTVKSGSNMKKTNSQLLLALSAGAAATEDTTQEEEKKEDTGLGVRVSSSNNLLAGVSPDNFKKTESVIEKEFKQGIGASEGFDLAKISSHYNHRRMLRREKMVFRYGELAALRCMNEESAQDPSG